jgi:NAD+ synthase
MPPMQTDKIIDHIVHWLTSYCRDSGLKGFVVGVSGGIDSAVTSTLCAKTQKKVLALNMPIYQSPDQITLSDRHIAWLKQHYPNVNGIKINLTGPFQSLEKTLPADIQDGLTMANTRARVRMLTLYAFAGHHRMLVAGTGNKVEDFGVGFYTKYGDGGVDLSPIADLVKTEVWALGKALGIHESILNAPPTDGLWGDNRTDECQIGASYAELECVMDCEENDRSPSELNARQREVLSIYRKFRKANRHKMMPIPVCRIPDSFRTRILSE